MDARTRFQRAINSAFQHFGLNGFYQRLGQEKQSVRLIHRQNDPLFELNDRPIVVDLQRIDVRVSELASPKIGDHFFIDNEIYRIDGEPKMDVHKLVWIIDVSPVNTGVPIQGQSSSRLRVR